MARSDLLVALIRAGSSGDREAVISAAEALVADERAKNHHLLADRMERAVRDDQRPRAHKLPSLSDVVVASASGRDAILESTPRIRLDDLRLPPLVRRSADQVVEEHIRADVLRAHGYEPRHRILLSGPPGNGKTAFAEAIAEALSLPLFVVRYDALITSFLGETNARLRALFEYVRTRPCVLFFDEFDAIGKERGDAHETGEIKRVVSYLLLQLDQVPSYAIVVAATNHAELLDRAVWRRFQFRLHLPQPGRKDVEAFVRQLFLEWQASPRISAQRVAGSLGVVSYAEIEDFCQNVRRRQILGLGGVSVDEAIQGELDLWASRLEKETQDGKRPKQAAASTSATRAKRPSRATKSHS